MNWKTKKTVLITKQCTFYQNVGNQQVGFELSEYHNHAVCLIQRFKWENPFNDGGFWVPHQERVEVFENNANLNDLETISLINDLKSRNIEYHIDEKIKQELFTTVKEK